MTAIVAHSRVRVATSTNPIVAGRIGVAVKRSHFSKRWLVHFRDWKVNGERFGIGVFRDEELEVVSEGEGETGGVEG